VIVLALVLAACSDDSGSRPDNDFGVSDGPPTSDRGGPTGELNWIISTVDDQNAGFNAHIASCGQKVGVAYFQSIDEADWPIVDCPDTFAGGGGPQPRRSQRVMYAQRSGTDWGAPVEVDQTVGYSYGLSMTYDSSCTAHIGYLGGPGTGGLSQQECASSNAIIASSSDGASWSTSVLATTPPNGGDTVGHWMSVAVDGSDEVHAAHREVQFGHYTQDGNTKASLMYDTTAVSNEDGSGVYAVLEYDPQGNPVIAHYNVGLFAGVSPGILIETRSSGGWSSNRIFTGSVPERLDLDTDGNGLFGVVYQDGGEKSLMYIEATGDLSNWTTTKVDRDLTQNGQHASLAYDSYGNPGIAYHRCGDYGEKCSYSKDAVMYAYRKSGSWKTYEVDTGDEQRCGEYASLTFSADDEPIIAYKCVAFDNLTNEYGDTLRVAMGVYK
jgi:hypothetical protein